MNEVSKWINSGAEVREGLRLLSIYAPNPHLDRLVNANPPRFRHLLIRALSPFADVRIDTRPQLPERRRRGLREDWPFLSDPSCPMELKVLASDKITAYHNYCDLHEKLFDCITPEDAFETAKNLLENYRQNRIILSEFAHYKEHGSILGKHPIFKESLMLSRYQAMTDFELFENRRRLEGAIWRIKSEISKGDKPHLLVEREARLKEKQRELEAVERMITEIDRKRRK